MPSPCQHTPHRFQYDVAYCPWLQHRAENPCTSIPYTDRNRRCRFKLRRVSDVGSLLFRIFRCDLWYDRLYRFTPTSCPMGTVHFTKACLFSPSFFHFRPCSHICDRFYHGSLLCNSLFHRVRKYLACDWIVHWVYVGTNALVQRTVGFH